MAIEEPNKWHYYGPMIKEMSVNFLFRNERKDDQTASYFQELGIQAGDKVMLILKEGMSFGILL